MSSTAPLDLHLPAAVVMAVALESGSAFSAETSTAAYPFVVWEEALSEYRRARAATVSQTVPRLFRPDATAESDRIRSGAPSTRPPAAKASHARRQTDDFFAMTTELERVTAAIAGDAAVTGASGSAFRDGASVPAACVDWVTLQPMDLGETTLFEAFKGHTSLADVHRAATLFEQHSFDGAAEVLLQVASTSPPPCDAAVAAALNGAAASYFCGERWADASRVSQRCLDHSRSCDVARRRLCMAAVAQGDVPTAQAALQPHRHMAHWATARAAVEELERYDALLKARLTSEAAASVARLVTLVPCGDIECWAVRLMLDDSRQAAARYAAARSRVYPHSDMLTYWALEAQLHNSVSLRDLTTLQQAVTSAGRLRHPTAASLLRALEQRVSEAVRVLADVEAATRAAQWEAVVEHCTNGLRADTGGGVQQVLLTRRAQAYMARGRVYQALDDAQRALGVAEVELARADLLLTIARCEERLRRLRDAIYHAQQAVAALPVDLAGTAKAYLRELERKRAEEEATPPRPTAGHGTGARAQGQPPRNEAPPSTAAATAVPGPHVVLCLPSDVDDLATVRRSYRALAVKWHPDKWCGADAADIRKAEEQFKLIQNAYEMLVAQLKRNGASP